DHRVPPEELGAPGGRADQSEQHAKRRRLPSTVRAEIAEDVAGLDCEVDPGDGNDVSVALDESARHDGRRVRHFNSRAADSAAAGGSEPASTKLVPPWLHSTMVPSCVASSCAVTPLSDTVGRPVIALPAAVESALRSTTTLAPNPCP